MGRLCHQGRHLILQAMEAGPWVRLAVTAHLLIPKNLEPTQALPTSWLTAKTHWVQQGVWMRTRLSPASSPFAFPSPFFFSLPCSFSFISSLPLANSCFSRRFLSLPLFSPLALDPWCSNKGVGGGVADGGGGGAGPGLIHHRRAGAGRAEPKQGNCWQRGGIFHR